MLDERDPLLLREFARGQRPLADAQFVAQVRGRLQVFSAGRLLAVALGGVVRAVSTGLSFGIVAPLKLRYAGLAAIAALELAVWAIVESSR
jgi:hypothetical protein